MAVEGKGKAVGAHNLCIPNSRSKGLGLDHTRTRGDSGEEIWTLSSGVFLFFCFFYTKAVWPG